MVKRSIDQKLRLRNFDARHGKIESAAVGKNRKGIIGVDGGKGICYQWREKGQLARRPLQFPPRNPRSCAKTRTHYRHTFRASPFTRKKCVGEEKHPRQSNHGSLRFKIRGSVPRRDWTTTAMCAKRGLGCCQNFI